MSVIDDNKMKLLKMREKLLSLNNDDEVLEEYKKIACDIDSNLYTSITDKINDNADYINYPLEKQLEFLIDLQECFDEYNKFQKNVIKVCNQHFIQGFELTDASLIRIDEIRRRINSIKKFLENERVIYENRLELDRLNNEYISEEQKANMFQERVLALDEELKNNVLKAEGRKTGSSGEIEYVSVLTEAKSLGIDLKQALSSDSIIDDEIMKTEDLADDANERLKSAQICYENNSNAIYKDVYFSIRKETVSIKYRLVFLKIIKLVSSYNSTYKQASRKRNELVQLIKDRNNLLEQLDVKYLYDPFDRIGLKEQLEIIRVFGNNYDKVQNARKSMELLSSDTDERIAENKKYSDYFKINIELIGNKVEILPDEEIVPKKDTTVMLHNRIMRVRSAPADFKIDRVREKTSAVIKRIYAVMDLAKEKNKTENVSPNLVIESDNDTQVFDDFDNDMTLEDDDLVENGTDLFEEIKPLEDTTVKTSDKMDTTNLFTEVNPFLEPQLFDDRYDDGTVFNNQQPVLTENSVLPNTSLEPNINEPTPTTVDINVSMPDVFWETSNEPVTDDNPTGVSFDEQIAALIGGEESSKTKKLVS